MTLTDDITRDLTQRLRAQRQMPEQLTLAALANEYGVSATPIRQALARLMDSGLVERLANGRLSPGHKDDTRTPPRKKAARNPRLTIWRLDCH